MDEKALISQLAEMMKIQTQGLIKYIDERVANMLTASPFLTLYFY